MDGSSAMIVYKCTIMAMPPAQQRCTSSRVGKVMLSCWISEDLRLKLDRVWAEQGLRPHGRTQQGMEGMIQAFLERHPSAEASEAQDPGTVPRGDCSSGIS
jgi:hypothetical protein